MDELERYRREVLAAIASLLRQRGALREAGGRR
jgi:hypothetical protein